MKKTNKDKNKKPGIFKKIVKYVLIILLVLLIFNIAPSFFYQAEKNSNPLPSFYKKGVYHLHSVFSDGKGTVDEITDTAAALDLDFVILTDHGRPNIKSATSTAWLNDVLLIGGTELSLNCGHLAAMGFEVPDYIFAPEPQEAINEIVYDNENGVCFVSHPFDDKIPWTDWDISGFTGLEVLSSYSAARRAGILKILIFPLKYLINSKYALLDTLGYPRDNIKKWDSLNNSGKYYGIYALDAHAKLPISKKIQLNFPTYKSMFEIMTVYVRLNKKFLQGPGAVFSKRAPGRRRQENNAHQAAAAIISSLRKGNFFNVIEGIAPANGFEAFFIEKHSGRRIEMGGSTGAYQGKLIILLPFDFETHVIIYKNGNRSEQIANKKEKQLEIDVNQPGVYRIEVYVPGNTFDDLPWIMTNPFFLGLRPKISHEGHEGHEGKEGKPLPGATAVFKVEKNNRSQGTIQEEVVGEDEKIIRFRFKLEKESPTDRDFWSALALREQYDLSGYQGFVFEARSEQRRRFWLEFRTKKADSETWCRHSFLVDKEWRKIAIPFAKFHVYHGRKKVVELGNVNAIFFAVNNALAYPGTEGEIFLKNFGIY